MKGGIPISDSRRNSRRNTNQITQRQPGGITRNLQRMRERLSQLAPPPLNIARNNTPNTSPPISPGSTVVDDSSPPDNFRLSLLSNQNWIEPSPTNNNRYHLPPIENMSPHGVPVIFQHANYIVDQNGDSFFNGIPIPQENINWLSLGVSPNLLDENGNLDLQSVSQYNQSVRDDLDLVRGPLRGGKKRKTKKVKSKKQNGRKKQTRRKIKGSSRRKQTKAKAKKIKKALDYAKEFEDMRYKFSEKPPLKDGPPFWIENSFPPTISYIKKYGSCCAGLTNLVRRYMGLEVPGHITGKKIHEFIGGTGAWFSYLESEGRLQKIDFTKIYPDGTLLLQNYSVENAGHLAIVLKSSKKGLLDSKIIHNVGGIFKEKKYREVVIELLKDYPDYKRFTHICLPEKWLLKN